SEHASSSGGCGAPFDRARREAPGRAADDDAGKRFSGHPRRCRPPDRRLSRQNECAANRSATEAVSAQAPAGTKLSTAPELVLHVTAAAMELTIEKMIYGGDGLARLAPHSPERRSKTVFIPFVLPGERVQAALVEDRPGFARAQLEKVLKASPARTPAPCPYFASCGGCHYQHTSYDEQLLLKAEILRETLRRTAKIELAVQLQVHPSPPFGYRNRTRFHVQVKPEFAIGYFRHGSHELLPVRECPISSPLINRALEHLWKIGTAKALANVVEIEPFTNGNDDDLLLEIYLRQDSTVNEDLRGFTTQLVSSIPALRGVVAFSGASSNRRSSSDRAEVLFGLQSLRYAVAGESYQVSAGAFFQTNRHLAERIVEV